MRKYLGAPLLAAAAFSQSVFAEATSAGEQHASTATTMAVSLLNIPILAVPEPSVAWLLALGFLGIVVLRRTRPGPMN